MLGETVRNIEMFREGDCSHGRNLYDVNDEWLMWYDSLVEYTQDAMLHQAI